MSSMCSDVMLGYRITATTSSVDEMVAVEECSTNPTHELSHGKFCPVCGAVVVQRNKKISVARTLHDVFFNPDRPWCTTLSHENIKWLSERFSPLIEPSNDTLEDILMFLPKCIEIDGAQDGFTPVNMKWFTAPSKTDLARLKHLLGYKKIIVEFGLNVLISY